MRSQKETELLNKLEEAAEQHGFDLVEIERAGSGRNALLRVFIDKEGGLTLDEVAAANTWVSEVIEALDVYRSSYTLEVSSPGVDRPLRTLAHFEKALGEEVVITLETALSEDDAAASKKKPRLKYTGVIEGVDSAKKTITIKADDIDFTLPLEQIKKARVKGHFDFEGKNAQ